MVICSSKLVIKAALKLYYCYFGVSYLGRALVIRYFLKIGEKFKSSPEAMLAVEEAQSAYGRRTLFEEWTKTNILCDKCPKKGDLAWVTVKGHGSLMAHGAVLDMAVHCPRATDALTGPMGP